MNNQQVIIDTVLAQKMLPLYYHADREVSIGVLKALYAAGIKTVEYTNRGEAALDNFIAMRKLADAEMPDMKLGIGTVKTVSDAESYIAAGADYIIAPVVNAEVAALVQKAGLLWIPGCLTPTEIFTAETHGAKLVKIFPGSVVGPSYITAIKELFPKLLFMPTGGVDTTVDNIKAWFESGVVAVGMGSKLLTKELLESGAYDKITARTKEVMTLVHALKK